MGEVGVVVRFCVQQIVERAADCGAQVGWVVFRYVEVLAVRGASVVFRKWFLGFSGV